MDLDNMYNRAVGRSEYLGSGGESSSNTRAVDLKTLLLIWEKSFVPLPPLLLRQPCNMYVLRSFVHAL